MQTKILSVSAENMDSCLREAACLLRAGELVAFPTETVYGLGADGFAAAAASGIYAAKGRPSDNPLILHVADRSMVDMAVQEVPAMAEKLMAAFWPGPLTLILRRSRQVPLEVTGGLDTVGIRMPDNDIARGLIKVAGRPIAAPSANLSGRPSPTTAAAVYADMQGRIPLILDGGACSFGVESTIIDAAGRVPVILRPGAVTREMLEEITGQVALDPALSGESAVPRAPGMKYTHYAPKAPLTLIEGEAADMAAAFQREILRLKQTGHIPGIIVSRETADAVHDLVQPELTAVYGSQGCLLEIASRLYSCLRGFDDKEADCLLAEGTTSQGLGLAIMNRLHKASGFRSLTAGKEK